MEDKLYTYILSIADNNLILGQRMGALCGHGPSLETDIACTNISLDLLGQVRSYFQYAANLKNDGTTEDTIAFLRQEREYLNVLLVEQPNTDFAFTIVRHFLYDVYHLLFLEELQKSRDIMLSSIAAKSIKEVRYHVQFSSDWVKRLGNGTEESHARLREAMDTLWVYTDELFCPTPLEAKMVAQGIAVDVIKLKHTYYQQVAALLDQATLEIPRTKWFQKGGKEGVHTEHMGYILSEMQYMQRTYPNMEW